MAKKWHWIFPILTVLVLLSGVFRINLSNSLPKTIFFAMPIASSFTLEKGQIVFFDHPGLNMSVGKIIAGKPGDIISIQNQTLYLNDIEIGNIHTVSKSGKTYHSIAEGTILEGNYFVYTPHLESFDSRYQEFGLVKRDWIKEVLCPLL